jgi:hypothetical protein
VSAPAGTFAIRTRCPTANFGCATSRRGLSPLRRYAMICSSRASARSGPPGRAPSGLAASPRSSLVREANSSSRRYPLSTRNGDAAEPLLVVTEFEVVEWIHRLGASADPLMSTCHGSGRHVGDRAGRHGRKRCGAAAHERMMNKEVVALVLQGGGALGAYWAGPFEALAAEDIVRSGSPAFRSRSTP